MQADRQTNRQTDIMITLLCTTTKGKTNRQTDIMITLLCTPTRGKVMTAWFTALHPTWHKNWSVQRRSSQRNIKTKARFGQCLAITWNNNAQTNEQIQRTGFKQQKWPSG